MLSSVPEVPLATCTGAVSPVVTAVPRAGGHAEQAWPVPGWVRHGPGWVRHGPGWVRHGPGWVRHGPGWVRHGPGWVRHGPGWVRHPGWAPTTQSEPKASRKAPDSPRRDWRVQAAGPSTPKGPGHAHREPDRHRVGIGGSRVISLSGSAPERSTGKQQPGPLKLRRSGLSRHSHLTGHQGDKSLASESAWV